jgi:tetratricopeptide (TPR) repeat protein
MSCDLELEIAPQDQRGVFRVDVSSPAGAASGELVLDAEELLDRRRELAACVLASAVSSRSRLTEHERPIREMGQALFGALFVDRVYGRYTASVQEAARRGEPLRIVLRLRAPELAGLPWETLFDSEVREYLCQREPVVRYVETAQAEAPLRVESRLRVLGFVAAPRDLPGLDVAEERRRLTDALAGLGNSSVDLVWAQGGSWPELQQQLGSGPWHVLHFVGHGGVDPSGEGGVLWLEDERTRLATSVSAARFQRLLHSARPVPRLVVLNSCQTGEAAADDLLSSTAAALVSSGVSACVAMQFAISDPAALAFARGFYQALARSEPIDEAVRLGRIAIDGTGEHTLEWLTPVLYLRTGDTRLFAISAQQAEAAADAPAGEQAAQEAALHGLYVQALAALRTGRDDEAVVLLDSVLALRPGYRDARARRDTARRQLQLANAYKRARAAEDAGNWEDATREYDVVTEIDPHYRDASERRSECHLRQQIASLQDELRLHADAQNWEAVSAVSEELAALKPEAADVDGLAATARRQMEEQARREAEARERRGAAPPDSTGQTVGRATTALVDSGAAGSALRSESSARLADPEPAQWRAKVIENKFTGWQVLVRLTAQTHVIRWHGVGFRWRFEIDGKNALNKRLPHRSNLGGATFRLSDGDSIRTLTFGGRWVTAAADEKNLGLELIVDNRRLLRFVPH